MPSPSPFTMNRRLLGDSGLMLSDDDYARTIAGLGATLLTWASDVPAAPPSIGWNMQNFLQRRRSTGLNPPPGVWRTYGEAWKGFLTASVDRRVTVETHPVESGGPDLNDIVRVLSHPAVSAASVILGWTGAEVDLRWQWPLRLGAFRDDFEALELARLRDYWPARGLMVPQVLGREASRVEILVARGNPRTVLGRILSLEHRVRTGFLVLLAPVDRDWRVLRSPVEALLAETQAGGLGIVSLPVIDRTCETLNEWCNHLSHNHPLDIALSMAVPSDRQLVALDRRLIAATSLPAAARTIARRLQRMAPGTSLPLPGETQGRIGLGWTSAQPPAMLGVELEGRVASGNLSYAGESHGASAIAEISAATREAARDEARDEAPRFLQGDLSWLSESDLVPESRGLVVGQRYVLGVFIAGPGEGALMADQAFPDEQLEWPEGKALTLQVWFAEPSQWDEPMRGTLELPETGSSTRCRFVFSPTQSGPFIGRLSLYYRGRILQTALLETVVVESLAALTAVPPNGIGMSFRVEAVLRRSLGTLDERRRFDACLVCNHTSVRKAAITAAGKEGAYIASLDTTRPAIASINGLLSQVAQDTRTYSTGLRSKGNAELLTQLAFDGNALYRALVLDCMQRSSSAPEVGSGEYLQIVTMGPEAVVPLEFVYEYPLPAKGAGVCTNAVEALQNGACPESCRPTVNPAPHVCPMGFWGLSKVIERHIHVPDLPKAAKVLAEKRGEPITGRDELSLAGATLLATSKQVPARKSSALDKALRQLRKGVFETVRDWSRWQKEIGDTKPVMLIVLPHAAGAGSRISLEIGGDSLEAARIDESYVHLGQTPPPVAILLGCDTANTGDTEAYLRHVEVFRQADAALILGTVATVLGTDAADMAEGLLNHLMATLKKGPARFGEALREAKRAAVADSLMIGLCLVAFGDADWKLSD